VTANATAKATADPYGMTTREQATANSTATARANARVLPLRQAQGQNDGGYFDRESTPMWNLPYAGSFAVAENCLI
jgi:hypothetical protein